MMENTTLLQGQTMEPRAETHRVSGDKVVAKIKEIVHEGNVRRLIIRSENGATLIEVPLTVGVVGALVAPVWAAIGAIAALVKHCSIEVERAGTTGEAEPPG